VAVVIRTMFLHRLAAAVTVLIAVATLATGVSGLTFPARGLPARPEVEELTKPTVNEPPPAVFHEPNPRLEEQARTGVPVTLTGRVVDEQGKPVPGADVRLRLYRHRLYPQLR